ncbi:MAG TPA: hypothetical protein PKK00_04945 [Bacteroidales bacterium]|nr:hypothetical protein [Bacteroidales bacterium]HPS16706.1 hypothetical protein [Bacteroidales bacterium]
MKTILYSLVAIFIFGIIAMGFTNKANTNNIILIQVADSNVSSSALSQSAKIISNRLKDFSSEKFDIAILPAKRQIQVTFTNNWDLKFVNDLITKKGTLAFYETYNRKSLSELLNDNGHLFSMFKNSAVNDSVADIGCCSVKESEKINDYINILNLDQKCKFVWSKNFDGSPICLYAIKLDSEKNALMSTTDIDSANYMQDKESRSNEIEVNFKKSSVDLWANATKHNIGNAIAIVLDNNVITAPIVRSEIDCGHCMISGNFSQDEAKYIASIINNGELPVTFKRVK